MILKYCGGCNIQYFRSNITKKLEELYKDTDILIILNGCQRGCLKFEDLKEKYKVINLQEYLVQNNNSDNSEEKILEWIEQEIKKMEY